MKTIELILSCVLLLAANISSAQTHQKRGYILRAETTTADQRPGAFDRSLVGVNRLCVVIYSDGHYRLEKTEQDIDGEKPTTKVYLDTLSDSEMKVWDAVLADNKFQSIKGEISHAGIDIKPLKDMDMLYISVPREHAVQDILFSNPFSRAPYDKSLKPFLKSLKNLERRRVPGAKNETPNNCMAP